MDENPVACEHFQRLCSSMGAEVLVEADQDAVASFFEDATVPRLLIMDCAGSNFSEGEFLKTFDEIASHHQVPLLITNPGIHPMELRRKYDASEIITMPKPVELSRLAVTINRIFNWDTNFRVPERGPGIILEDVETTGVIIQKLMDTLGVETIVCETAKEFKVQLDVILPEIVTLDLFVPDGDARDMCKDIRREKKMDELPIVVISGSPDRDAILDCLRFGANDHISKPIVKEEFFARVSNLLKLGMLQKQARNKQDELESLAFTDGLTRIFNRAYMEIALRNEIDRSTRSGQPLGVLLIDLDFFKQVNDCHGHETGDEVLAEFGTLLKRSVRSYDIPCRYGGEEFCVLLPGSTATNVVTVAERIRKACEQHLFSAKELQQHISIGTSVFPETSAADSVISDADKALYSAKQGGRNRTIVSLPRSVSS